MEVKHKSSKLDIIYLKGNSLYRSNKLHCILHLAWAIVTLWCCSYNMGLLLMLPPRTTTLPCTSLRRRVRRKWPVCCWSMVHPSPPPPRRASHPSIWQPSMEIWRLLVCFFRKMRQLMLKERTVSLPCMWLPIMTIRCVFVSHPYNISPFIIVLVVKIYWTLLYCLIIHVHVREHICKFSFHSVFVLYTILVLSFLTSLMLKFLLKFLLKFSQVLLLIQ